ncbi:rhomboid family intramembrane serine protease [Hominifimenecus sp. rT4P-3]|uniref:rhomboid family intramembrane serine protease n=1 Tax=Hominifimenecus sp. rT4P-3 TaxID=3242979 RepID=UPI003DA48B62
MNFIDKLERKFGRFAVRNLMIYLIAMQAVGFVLNLTNPTFYIEWLSLNPYAILHGQIWRLVTFLIFPSSSDPFLLVIGAICFLSIGRLLEQMWGTFRLNLYLLVGIVAIIIGAFLIYPFYGPFLSIYAAASASLDLYSTLILAIALMLPDVQFMLFFVIPVKAKWLGIFYGVIVAYDFIKSSWPGRIMVFMTVLNFLLFFFLYRKPVQRAKQVKRKVVYQHKVHQASSGPRHRCAVCGRTELDDPSLEFRFCSKCEGNYEYCQDHLYTHKHVTKGDGQA